MIKTTEQWNAWMRDFSRDGHLEAWRGIQCFFRWIEIRAANGHPVPSFLEGLEEDIRHSGLLRRLIEGKEPLPAPPPESFGQPWYELIETGEALAEEVQPIAWAPDSKLLINGGVWTIAGRTGDGGYQVCFRDPAQLFRLSRDGDSWRLRTTR